jgi:glycosyltransferase involved in cell wall biosynthesis
MRRQSCGVSDYASLLEGELRHLGHEVTAVDHNTAARLAASGSFDRALLHFELVQSTRRGEIFWLGQALTRLQRRGIQTSAISHTLLSDRHLDRVAFPIAFAIKVYQRRALRWLSSRTDLIVLNSAAVDVLKSIGVRSRYVPLGVYGGSTQQAESSLSRFREEGRLICAVVGHPYRFKRYPLAARAFLAVSREVRGSAVFAVVGGDAASDPDSWQELMATRDAFDRDAFVATGRLDEGAFWSTIQDVDIALLPYEHVATGSATVANLSAAHVPMIVSTSSAFRALTEAGGAIAVDDWPCGAAEVLGRLIADPLLRAEISDALRRLEQRESLAASAEAMLDVKP